MTSSIIEVAYAKSDRQVVIEVSSVPHITVQQAIEASGILQQFPEIDLAINKIGVFGKLTQPDSELVEGDRVEIYRPLIADPKEARRRRAKAASEKR